MSLSFVPIFLPDMGRLCVHLPSYTNTAVTGTKRMIPYDEHHNVYKRIEVILFREIALPLICRLLVWHKKMHWFLMYINIRIFYLQHTSLTVTHYPALSLKIHLENTCGNPDKKKKSLGDYTNHVPCWLISSVLLSTGCTECIKHFNTPKNSFLPPYSSAQHAACAERITSGISSPQRGHVPSPARGWTFSTLFTWHCMLYAAI